MISETLRNVALRTITVRKNFSMITDDKVSNFFCIDNDFRKFFISQLGKIL